MNNNNEHLNFDLGFLGDDRKEPLSQSAAEEQASSDTFNWRNTVIGGALAVVLLSWFLGANNNGQSGWNQQTSGRQPPSQNQGQSPSEAPTSPPSAQDFIFKPSGQDSYSTAPSGDMVSTAGGQYSCSRSAMTALDGMEPTGKAEIERDKEDLLRAKAEIENIKFKMNLSGVTQYSSQHDIDGYNALVEEYNTKLGAFKSDLTSHEARVDAYNKQIDARNDYLTSHCTRNW